MIIDEIQIIHDSVPTIKPYVVSDIEGTLISSEAIFVRLHTSDGIVGWGETDPDLQPIFCNESIESIEGILRNYLAPVILGMDPFDIGLIHERMDKIVTNNLFAKAAVDIAIYDIIGKALNMPLYKFLGGALRNKISVLWPLGSNTSEANTNEAIEKVKQGFKSFMIKTAALPMREDIKRVKAIRKAVGENISLIVDANQGWDYHTTIQFVHETEQYKIEFIEQPVPSWDIRGLKRLRESINIPVSADESLFSVRDAYNLISEKAVDIFSIKMSKHGGIYNTKKIINLANVAGINCYMNSQIEMGISQAASLHVGVTVPNIVKGVGHAYMSVLRLEDDVTNIKTWIKNGYIKVGDKPGLGIEVDEEKIKKYKKEMIVIKL